MGLGALPQASPLKPSTATGGIRTLNLRFTKPLLCQLSYGGDAKEPRSAQSPTQLAFASGHFGEFSGGIGS